MLSLRKSKAASFETAGEDETLLVAAVGFKESHKKHAISLIKYYLSQLESRADDKQPNHASNYLIIPKTEY